jgi:nucleoside triphosphatase
VRELEVYNLLMGKQVFPEPTVGALIFNPKGEIFLMKSHKWAGKYVIPGGHIELGETMLKALKREIKEETGLIISNIKPLHYSEFIFDKAFWKKRHFILFDFTAKAKSSKVKLNDEGQEYIWVKPRIALKLPVEPYTIAAVKKYLSN